MKYRFPFSQSFCVRNFLTFVFSAVFSIVFLPGDSFAVQNSARPFALSASATTSVTETVTNETEIPILSTTVPAEDVHHVDRFEEKAKIIENGRIDLVFLGDSITHFWDVAGLAIQEKYFGDLRRVNLGLGWNCSQHVLWELENIQADKISPKAVMLMIGTNNIGNKKNTPEETAFGNAAVIRKVHALWPNAKILVLGIFPRGNLKDDPLRAIIQETNQKIEKLADRQNVFFLDIGERFLNEDGTLPKNIAYDFLHLTPDGYEIWGKSVAPLLRSWVAE